MKKFILGAVFCLYFVASHAYTDVEMGLIAGFNSNKLTANLNSENIMSWHLGAFFRFGNRLYFQPEGYFNSKGGDLNEVIDGNFASFNYNTIDVPGLIGLKIYEKNGFNFHAMTGPVFSFITSGGDSKSSVLDSDFYKNHYYGWQYGIGITFKLLYLDARIENSSRKIYSSPNLRQSRNSLLVTLGLNLLW